MKVFSMFDGVGGFIIGLNNADDKFFETTYSNQYEPSRKAQDAFEVGVHNYPEMEHIPDDVETIPDEKFKEIKDNGVDMIVGGFPCQDYSVARSKKGELGIEGKKGVLFWQIIRATEIIKPKYLVLENVDRLLKSPSSQRGRDFAVMLAAFNNLGYSVEWRVINAADYGRAQRRRRVFFYIYSNDLGWSKYLDEKYEVSSIGEDLFGNEDGHRYDEYIFSEGLFAKQFPIHDEPVKNRFTHAALSKDIVEVSDNYQGRMWNTGVMRHGHYYSYDTEPIVEEAITLGEIVQPESEIDEKYYLTPEQIEKFEYLRGAKRIERVSAEGHKYVYSEGGMSPYDTLDLPGRTMLTSEGSINRSTHLLFINGRYRFITPIEAERMQDFPDDWTKYKQTTDGETLEVTDRMRLFFMGNALVTGIVTRIGKELQRIDEEYN